MKYVCGLVGVTLLLLTGCSAQPEKEVTSAHVSSTATAVRQPESPIATIHRFLNWYEQHQTPLNSLPLVPAALDEDTIKAFAIDFQAVERYVRLLQSSGTVSPRYLAFHRRYFQQCQDSLQAHRQTDGLINGLDFDRVIYSQAGEDQTRFVLRSEPTCVTINADTAQVLYQWSESSNSDGSSLAFSLAREQDRWMITAIRPLVE